MDARLDSDYDMVYEADEATAYKLIADAERFVERIQLYLAAEGLG